MSPADRIRAYTSLVAFIVAMSLPAIVHLAGLPSDGKTVSTENRALSSPPPMPRSMDEALDLSSRLDEYVADRFGLRARLVESYSRFNYRLGVSSDDDVMVGRDGWLFFRGQGADEQLLRTRLLDEAELEAWDTYLDEVVRHADAVGAEVVVTVAPNSQRINLDKLPTWFAADVRAGDGPTELDQFERLVRGREDMRYVDLTTPLLQARLRGEQVYRRYDSHWTDVGAFIGYRTLWNEIFGASSGIRASDVSYEMHPEGGDLAEMLALGDVLEESLPRALVDAPAATSHPLPDGPKATRAQLSEGPEDGPRVVVIGDSFGLGLLPYAAPSSSSLLYENHERGRVDLSWIGEMEPDVVILEVVERWLGEPFVAQQP